ncbi:tape measure protein [Pseudomonas petrae]|uniref:Tape measure protein n=1 Tax=Pseudomonas petrae TaxID=2912190 RepID=A0ABS9I376_9PSED|nr:tape measure protein [Pseudomonas petrae]MCF7533781.1 tape measure protein [Pseudomonas petrae]MCF7538328.1 tape measure protein [Pseudomonas petrae]MCF7542248.1 tape measure protein [Pseudomonas petrae]MCF7555693.1 tape measure protein [Pseudomonas petrae]
MMNQETIAKLVGQLSFHVDLSGLERFQRGMEQARQRMMAMSKQADQLSKSLGTKMGLKVDTTARDKLDRQVRTSLDRELKGEVMLQKARRATFAAELAGQKLQFAGQRESSFLTTQSLKDRQQMAVLAAKESRAEQARLKVQGQTVKNEDALASAKARQARVEALHAQQVQRTLNLQAQQQRTMTATQRLEQSMQQARERSQRQSQKYIESQQAAKLRGQRQDVSHQQRQQRFEWQQTRQQQWEANQNKPEPSGGFLGLGTAGLAVGGAAAGAAAIVAAINALGERMSATQERVSGSQQFTNVLAQAGGNNPANQKIVADEFVRIGQKFGTALDIDSAKMYRTFIMAETARGSSLSKAIGTFETRQAAFRGAGMTREEQTRANLQLQQIMGKSQSDREDLNTFTEAAPLLIEPIRRAWAARNKHKLDGNLEKDFRASTTAGNLKSVDFTNGIELFVKENAAAIQRQSDSIDANSTRLSNQQFLQQQGIDKNPDLINAINERIKSEQELNEAMAPLKQTSANLDIALNKLMTSALGWVFNKDGTSQTNAAKIDALSPDKPAIDLQALTGVDVDPSKARQQDPIDRLYNFLTGASDYTEGPATKMRAAQLDFSGALSLPQLDMSKFEQPEIDSKFHQIMRNMQPMSAPELSFRAAQRFFDESPSRPQSSTVNNNNTPINVTNNVTVNAQTGATAEEISRLVETGVTDKTKEALRDLLNQHEMPQDTE